MKQQESQQPRRKPVLFKSVLTSLLFCIALWPIWIALMTCIDWVAGEGTYTSQLDLLPKKHVLSMLLSDYLRSLVVCVPACVLLFIELFAFRNGKGSRLFAGILTTMAITATAYWCFKADMNPVLIALLSSLLALVFARLTTATLGCIKIGRRQAASMKQEPSSQIAGAEREHIMAGSKS